MSNVKQNVMPRLTTKQGGNAMFSGTELEILQQVLSDQSTDLPPNQTKSYREHYEKTAQKNVERQRVQAAKNRTDLRLFRKPEQKV